MSDIDKYMGFLHKMQGAMTHLPQVIEQINKIEEQTGMTGLNRVGVLSQTRTLLGNMEALFRLMDNLQRGRVVDRLLNMAWFADIILLQPKFDELDELFAQDKYDDIDNLMVEHTRERMNSCLESVEEHYPARVPLILQAEKACEAEAFGPAVILLLSQCDGIVAETFKFGFFSNWRQKKEKCTITPDYDFLQKLYILPLINKSSIKFSEHTRDYMKRNDEYYQKLVLENRLLNRHTIIHGEDCEYGTAVNAWKCWSLLQYLLFVHNYYIYS